MKKNILFFLLVYSCLFLRMGTSFAQNTWVQKANFPGGARFRSVAFSIGNKGYLGLGHDGISITYKDFWEYDPIANSWTQKANFPCVVGRGGAVGFSIGNKGYVGTGVDTSVVNEFWEYDPALDTWTQKASIDLVGREAAVGFSIGNKGYIGTGVSGAFPGNSLNDFWQYNPATDVWTRKADFGGLVRYDASGFSIGGKGYIGLGSVNLPGAGAYSGDFWEYDTLTDAWTQKAYLPASSRYGAVGFSIGLKGYFGTGYFGYMTQQNLNDFWEYNPTTDAWIQAANFGGAGRAVGVGFSIGAKGYIGTGSTSGSTIFNDIWAYTPDLALSINNSINPNNGLIIYPNPSAGLFSITINKNNSSEITVKIFNAIGQQIIEMNKVFEQNISFDLTKQQNGLYFILIDNGAETITKKVIINH